MLFFASGRDLAHSGKRHFPPVSRCHIGRDCNLYASFLVLDLFLLCVQTFLRFESFQWRVSRVLDAFNEPLEHANYRGFVLNSKEPFWMMRVRIKVSTPGRRLPPKSSLMHRLAISLGMAVSGFPLPIFHYETVFDWSILANIFQRLKQNKNDCKTTTNYWKCPEMWDVENPLFLTNF